MESTNLLTVRESARLLGVSERTLFRWIKNGDVKFKRLGNSTRIPANEIDRLTTV